MAGTSSGTGGTGAGSGGSSMSSSTGFGGMGGTPCGGGDGQQPCGETRFGIAEDRFTLDGQPTFLLGVSYFDGRNWHQEDLDELAARKFNLIRIWLDWGDHSFFDASGALAAQDTLLDLVHACAARGIVVDATILDTDLTLSPPAAAVESAVLALGSEPNVFFDLANEHDHAGNTFSHDDVTALAQAARAKNADMRYTVSSQGGHIVDDLTLDAGNIDAEIIGCGLDFLTPHLSRTADFYDKTDQRVGMIKEYLATIGKTIPVYLQEEARRGHSGLDPTKDQFLQAAREARDAGAAAWILHTDAGFDLAAASFFESLDPEEHATVDALGAEIFGN
jgi:hypothetical protein